MFYDSNNKELFSTHRSKDFPTGNEAPHSTRPNTAGIPEHMVPQKLQTLKSEKNQGKRRARMRGFKSSTLLQ